MKIPLWVGKSCIHGKGLFTAQHIKRGTRIIQYIGEKIPREEGEKRLAQGNDYIFRFNDSWDIDGKILWNKARYINHSCNPNCTIHITTRSIWIVALRDIQAGEELTFNYGYGIDERDEYICTCGSENCFGYILAEEYWWVIKKKYC